MMNTTFRKNLTAIRKHKGLSQRDLAKLTGLNQRMIVYYEKETINPPIDKIELIAKALGVTPSDLLGTYENSSIDTVFNNIDTRTLKRLKQIISLTPQERNTIYALLDSILEKKNKRRKKEKS